MACVYPSPPGALSAFRQFFSLMFSPQHCMMQFLPKRPLMPHGLMPKRKPLGERTLRVIYDVPGGLSQADPPAIASRVGKG